MSKDRETEGKGIPLRLVHIGIHRSANANAGDTVLFDATRKCFEHFLTLDNHVGFHRPIVWHLKDIWEPFSADEFNGYDGIVLGGGGLFLPDQIGASSETSGWQWNCTLEELDKIAIPLIVFGVGDNLFRGQKHHRQFAKHANAVASKAAFFSLREMNGCRWMTRYTHSLLQYQPCPTTMINRLYKMEPEVQQRAMQKNVIVSPACDRSLFRFQDDNARRVEHAVAVACSLLGEDGYTVRFLLHKQIDSNFLDWGGTVIDLSKSDTLGILKHYASASLCIGMRGHAQLISLGLLVPALSIISHDKLRRVLDDISRPEWGVDVNDRYFDLALAMGLEIIMKDEDMPRKLRSINEGFYQKTQRNFLRIAECF
jgi:hypothetical protein